MIIMTLGIVGACWAYVATMRLVNRRIDKLSELAVKTAEAEVCNHLDLKVIHNTNTFLMNEVTSLQMQIKELKDEKSSKEKAQKGLSTGIPSCPEQHMACDKAGLC